ncbi:MAG: acyltransferase [Verrucomicrobiota bacterium JB025]|nr:acyltransferase [Verrucomicrobiota bacterium JB025]
MKRIILELQWAFTRLYLRFKGAELGKNVRCNGIPHVKIRKGGRLIIGDNVQINCSPWANAHVVSGSTNFFVGNNATLRLGSDSGVSGCRIVAYENIEIGESSLVGAGSLLCDSDMHEVPLGNPTGIRIAPISIGRRVFLGAHSIVTKGITIGDGAVIGAGSIVSSSIAPSTLAAGNPCRQIRTLDLP